MECEKSYQKFGGQEDVVLWLGNSQLHAINEYAAGQRGNGRAKTAQVSLTKIFVSICVVAAECKSPGALLTFSVRSEIILSDFSFCRWYLMI